MFGLKAYLYSAVALAALALVGYGYTLQAKAARLAAEVATLRANVQVYRQQAAERDRADQIEASRQALMEQANADVNAALDAIRAVPTDACLDAPLPDAILEAIQ